MARVSVEDLLRAGSHFGHLTSRWNPKMAPYIFMERNGIHIIDLKQSQAMLDEAAGAIGRIAGKGRKVLFVGTKKQAQEIVRTEAERCGMPYVTERWLGGMLTNFQTIRRSIRRMEQLVKEEQDGTAAQLKKKERLMRSREREKLEKTLGGIADMNRLPNALFVVDTNREHIAVQEARKLDIPVFALLDTNCDPDHVDYGIPANDDAMKSIQVVTHAVAEAVAEAARAGEMEREARKAEQEKRQQDAAAAKAQAEAEAAEEVVTMADAEAEASADG
ncbi:MAG: 30S ribosomal protein S2 [Bacteroidota bacterium]